MASSPIVWTPDKRMILQSAVADLSPEAFQAVVGKVFGPATLATAARALEAFGAPTVKSCGGPVMAHNTNTKIFLKRAGRGRKKAVLQHSPFMPYGDCEFSITAAGVVDAVDG